MLRRLEVLLEALFPRWASRRRRGQRSGSANRRASSSRHHGTGTPRVRGTPWLRPRGRRQSAVDPAYGVRSAGCKASRTFYQTDTPADRRGHDREATRGAVRYRYLPGKATCARLRTARGGATSPEIRRWPRSSAKLAEVDLESCAIAAGGGAGRGGVDPHGRGCGRARATSTSREHLISLG